MKVIMKKGLKITGEIILLVIVLLVIKQVMVSAVPDLSDRTAAGFMFCCLAGMGGVLIYRLNTKNGEG